jgi:glutamate formiminotransferase
MHGQKGTFSSTLNNLMNLIFIRKYSSMLTECVVNISEGRNLDTIREVVRRLEQRGARVLHVDAGYGAHRTVITLVADSSSMRDAVLALYEVCISRINMNFHNGCHPRIGAVDVCPFIPLEGKGVQAPEAVMHLQAMCHYLAGEIARTFDLPVYLYGLSASHSPESSTTPAQTAAGISLPESNFPNRAELSFLRRGGFEGLTARMNDPHFAPDFGSAKPHPTAGATVLGVRDFLVAYNVTLNSKDLKMARQGASFLRSLSGVKALGWYIPEYENVQISCNITRTREVSIADVFNEVEKFAASRSVGVKGSELIGLIPVHNLELAFHQAQQQGEHRTFEQFVPSLVARLGLSLHGLFEPHKRVLEWVL